MFPRHHLMSATLLALVATLSEEDSPVVPTPEPDDAALADMRARAAERMAALEQGMREAAARADEAAGRYAEIDAALTGAVGGSLNFMIGGGSRNGRNMYKEYLRRNPVWTDPDPTVPKWVRCEQRPRPQQRAAKKARAKRKAKKGWA